MVEVFKHDGTLQCDRGKEIPLEMMRTRLEKFGAKVVKAEKRLFPAAVIQLCGAATGWCNVFTLSDESWPLLAKVILGDGFGVWPDSAKPKAGAKPQFDGGPWPFALPLKGAKTGTAKEQACGPTLADVAGMRLRVVYDDEIVTQEYLPDRLTILLSRKNSRIVQARVG